MKILVGLLSVFLIVQTSIAVEPQQPNVLFIIADDASVHFGEACHTVRRDMLDYAMEIEAFDGQVGSLLAALDASGLANNTLVIVTSDHGMPFPRVKGHTFDDAHHIPFVACWPDGIVRPGRRWQTSSISSIWHRPFWSCSQSTGRPEECLRSQVTASRTCCAMNQSRSVHS